MRKGYKAKEQTKRFYYATDELEALGYKITFQCESRIEFIHEGEKIMFFPYTGWASGKSINDGRGIDNLLKQLNEIK